MKKISTKITVSMIAVAFAVLSFVGVMLIINMTIDYHRNFERTVTSVFATDSFENSKIGGTDSVEQYILSEWDGICRDSHKEYYLLLDGNIISSSKHGGLLQMTPNLSQVLNGGTSHTPDITSKTLDFAIDAGNGLTVYILDNKEDLYQSLKNIAFLFIQALFIGILIAALLSFIISKRLTASLKLLEEGAKRMSKGDFTKITVKSRDEINRLCTVFNDMGEQIQHDFDEFDRVEKSRREFVANVSHELKTPLTVIKSYSQTLCQNTVDTDMQTQFLSVIDSEVDRMTDIVGQLLKVSRLNEQVTSFNTVYLHNICHDIIDTLKLEADKKQLTITLTGTASVTANADNTATVITNLLTNAIKYSDTGGTITVTVQDGDHPSVTVTDNGIGIPEEDLPHIFERFYRTDKARGRKTGGTGLGLAIALECAKSMNADIKVTSVQGEYTKFILEF